VVKRSSKQRTNENKKLNKKTTQKKSDSKTFNINTYDDSSNKPSRFEQKKSSRFESNKSSRFEQRRKSSGSRSFSYRAADKKPLNSRSKGYKKIKKSKKQTIFSRSLPIGQFS